MLDNERLKEYIKELERFATELVDAGHITRENVDDKRKEAYSDAELWANRYGDQISKDAREHLYNAVFALHFANFIRDIRIKVARIKMESLDWYHHVKPSLNIDGTVTIIADQTINRLNDWCNMFDAVISNIIDMVWASHGFMGAGHGIYPRG